MVDGENKVGMVFNKDEYRVENAKDMKGHTIELKKISDKLKIEDF